MIKTLFYSQVKDLWGDDGEAGGLFSSLVFRADDCCHLCVPGLLWDLSPRIFMSWSWRDQVGVVTKGRKSDSRKDPVSRAGVGLIQALNAPHGRSRVCPVGHRRSSKWELPTLSSASPTELPQV